MLTSNRLIFAYEYQDHEYVNAFQQLVDDTYNLRKS